MANTKGGIVIIEKISIDVSKLDSAKIDDKVNSFVHPRVHNIITEKYKIQGIKIRIPNSTLKPHIFLKEGTFMEGSKQKYEFHPGQIWVRHSAKNEVITPDDFRRFVKENLNEFLERISVIAAQYPIKETELSGKGTPLKIKPIKLQRRYTSNDNKRKDRSQFRIPLPN